LSPTSPRHGSRLVGLFTLVVLLAATAWTATANADTIFPPGTGSFTVTVTVNGTTYSYPAGGPGPTIPNVNNGDTVGVAIADAAGGPDTNFARLRVRQCAGNREVSNNTEFNPFVTNRCSSVTLGSGSTNAFVDSGPVAPGTTSLSTTFKIGTGTAPDVEDPVFGTNLPGFTCGAGNACKLVVNAEVSTGVGSSNYLGFPITFFAAPPSELVLMDCSNVGLIGAVKAPLNDTRQANVALSLKSTTGIATQYPRTCTGDLAAAAGPLTQVSGKFTGSMSCSAAASGPAPVVLPSGKLSFTWTTNDPIKLKPLTSSTFVRLDQTADFVDQVSISNGLVTKGVGIGADVTGSMLLQPTDKKGPAGQSTLAANGTVVPGSGSTQIATNCAAGVGTISAFVASTDGTTLSGAPFDGNLKFRIPA
jgi:hypothetical protein